MDRNKKLLILHKVKREYFSQYNTSYNSVLNYAIDNNIPVPDESTRILQNQLVVDLKAQSIWNLEDIILVPAGAGSDKFAKINWKSPGNYVPTLGSSVTWNNGKGFILPGGANSYINTNYRINTSATYNDFSMIINMKDVVPTPYSCFIGSSDETYSQNTKSKLFMIYYNTHMYGNVWGTEGGNVLVGYGNLEGSFLFDNILGTRKRLRKDYNCRFIDTAHTATNPITLQDIIIGAYNLSGVYSNQPVMTCGYIGIGKSNEAAETSKFSLVTTYTRKFYDEIYTNRDAASTTVDVNLNITGVWVPANITVTSSNEQAYNGTYSLKAVSTTAVNNNRCTYDFGVVSGKQYTISVWAKRGVGVNQGIGGFTGFTGAPAAAELTSADWTNYTWTLTANVTGKATISVYSNVGTAGSIGDSVYFDNISIKQL